MDDKILIEEAKRRDGKAFEALVQKYHNELYHTALGIVRSSWDAMDICQDTFLKAFSSLNKLRDPGKFRAWINRILINRCNDYFRHNQKVIVSGEIEREDFLKNENKNENEEAMDLLKTLSSLKKETRTVLVLRYFQDLSIKEIASIAGCPEGTVKSRISNGLKELRRLINAENDMEVLE
ncbi:MAG: RNA polymerase sigma factor [Clostridiales bacterium]|nr:RNA polymerase sigma factor [Clostridiales bacterium]